MKICVACSWEYEPAPDEGEWELCPACALDPDTIEEVLTWEDITA